MPDLKVSKAVQEFRAELQEVDDEVSWLARDQEQAQHRFGELQAMHQVELQRVDEERTLERQRQQEERLHETQALQGSFEEMTRMVQGLETQLQEGRAGVGTLASKLVAQQGQLTRATRDAEAARLDLSALQTAAGREVAEYEARLNLSVLLVLIVVVGQAPALDKKKSSLMP